MKTKGSRTLFVSSEDKHRLSKREGKEPRPKRMSEKDCQSADDGQKNYQPANRNIFCYGDLWLPFEPKHGHPVIFKRSYANTLLLLSLHLLKTVKC